MDYNESNDPSNYYMKYCSLLEQILFDKTKHINTIHMQYYLPPRNYNTRANPCSIEIRSETSRQQCMLFYINNKIL